MDREIPVGFRVTSGHGSLSPWVVRIPLALCWTMLVLCVVAGLAWWGIGLYSGAFRRISADAGGRAAAVLLALAAIQVASWWVGLVAVRRACRVRTVLRSWATVGWLLGLLVACALWGFTPAVGAPLTLLVLLTSIPLLLAKPGGS